MVSIPRRPIDYRAVVRRTFAACPSYVRTVGARVPFGYNDAFTRRHARADHRRAAASFIDRPPVRFLLRLNFSRERS
ncbi:hypothetical protein BRPE64_ACDS21070 [Caballeronia insecticola]|uniref:Uncharacterized protein n=1 Tax=Caballeronia insecticola TaxID=758793 RepID=R4WXQ1_9BURK|nr:hypothetical protein BRPE64_ACDS21070 [Caballeronia insecticola]